MIPSFKQRFALRLLALAAALLLVPGLLRHPACAAEPGRISVAPAPILFPGCGRS